MTSKHCAGCGDAFHPRPQTPKQAYCSALACQRERRRRWQRERRQHDPAYRDNQSRAQASWAARHPEYWREYRRAHPEYSVRNGTLQRERDARQRVRVLAKMDASTAVAPVPSGTYRLTPVTPENLAKMDAWMVEITVVSAAYQPAG
jgi:hypothetical protein